MGGAIFSINPHTHNHAPLCIGVTLCWWGTKTVPHKKKGTEVAPLGAPNDGQPNNTPRNAVLAPFFLSVVFPEMCQGQDGR